MNRNRNPVRHYGETPFIGYVSVPNDFARGNLHPATRGLAVEILSHQDGYGVSVAEMARNAGCTRRYVQKRIDELVAAHWLVLREHRTSKGHAFFEYCIRSDRPFTSEEIAELSEPVTIPDKPAELPADESDTATHPEPSDNAERPAAGQSDAIADPWGTGADIDRCWQCDKPAAFNSHLCAEHERQRCETSWTAESHIADWDESPERLSEPQEV